MDELDQLIEFLEPYPPSVRELMLDGRLRLLELLGPVNEFFFDATAAVCAGFAHTAKTRDVFVNFAAYSDHVTLVFGWGASLTDPERRLRGEGNQVRHVRLKCLEDLSDPYLVGLILAASDRATQPAEPTEPCTIVKIYQGPKRRPKG